MTVGWLRSTEYYCDVMVLCYQSSNSKKVTWTQFLIYLGQLFLNPCFSDTLLTPRFCGWKPQSRYIHGTSHTLPPRSIHPPFLIGRTSAIIPYYDRWDTRATPGTKEEILIGVKPVKIGDDRRRSVYAAESRLNRWKFRTSREYYLHRSLPHCGVECCGKWLMLSNVADAEKWRFSY